MKKSYVISGPYLMSWPRVQTIIPNKTCACACESVALLSAVFHIDSFITTYKQLY